MMKTWMKTTSMLQTVVARRREGKRKRENEWLEGSQRAISPINLKIFRFVELNRSTFLCLFRVNTSFLSWKQLQVKNRFLNWQVRCSHFQWFWSRISDSKWHKDNVYCAKELEYFVHKMYKRMRYSVWCKLGVKMFVKLELFQHVWVVGHGSCVVNRFFQHICLILYFQWYSHLLPFHRLCKRLSVVACCI